MRICVSLHSIWMLGIVKGRWGGRLVGRLLGGIGFVFIIPVAVDWRGLPACPWPLSLVLQSWLVALFAVPC